MFRSLEKTYEEKAELNKIAQLRANRKYKYLSMAFGMGAFALLIIMIAGLDSFSSAALWAMGGCTGFMTILFLIFVGWYLYRVNYSYNKQKSQHSNKI